MHGARVVIHVRTRMHACTCTVWSITHKYGRGIMHAERTKCMHAHSSIYMQCHAKPLKWLYAAIATLAAFLPGRTRRTVGVGTRRMKLKLITSLMAVAAMHSSYHSRAKTHRHMANIYACMHTHTHTLWRTRFMSTYTRINTICIHTRINNTHMFIEYLMSYISQTTHVIGNWMHLFITQLSFVNVTWH